MESFGIVRYRKGLSLFLIPFIASFVLAGCGNGDDPEAAGASGQPFEGVIDTPNGNMTINVGESVDFSGSVADSGNNGPFSFSWDFGGGATNQTVEDPGAVTFNSAGVFTVTFTATDSAGLADATPDTRTVTVLNQAPNGVIDVPATDVTITSGQGVTFGGTASDPDNHTPFSFTWDFGGGAPGQAVEDPGAVTFSKPGVYTVTFTVTDAFGLADPTPDTRTVTVLNQAPNGVIDAPAADVTIISGQGVTFGGTASDPDGSTPFSFLWDFGGGAPNQTAEDPGAVTFNTPGVYTVTFTVTDAFGLADSSPDTRTITVLNQAPNGIINAPGGDVTITSGQSIMFGGSVIDPDNSAPFSFAWDFGGGAANRSVEDPGSVTFSTPGRFTITFTVTDALGLADPTPATLKVTVLNQAPNGRIDNPIGDITLTSGQSFTFTGSASDPDNSTPFSFLWDFGGGAPNQTVEDPGAATFNIPGVYTVTFTVTDALGLADPTPDIRTVTVLNQAPNGVIDLPAGDATIISGQSVNFGGSATDPDNSTPFSFLWDFGGGAPNQTVEDPGAVTFNIPGVYTVTFTVTDALGLADPTPDTRTITVTNQAPNGLIDTPATNVIITSGQNVHFTGSATDPDNSTPFSFSWDFGGGAANQSEEDPGSVSFATPGVYTVTFTVTDALGLVDPSPDTRTITVLNKSPEGVIDAPAGDVTIAAGEAVFFNGTASDPDNSTPFSFLWDFGGGAANQTVEDPGVVTFATPGVYTVTFTVTDGLALADPTPDTRTITVTTPLLAYVANSSANTVSAFKIDSSSGALTKIGADVSAGTNPRSIAVDPNGRFAYVANFGGTFGTVSAYTIDATTGTLTKIGTDVAAGRWSRSIAVDPSGRFVYVANILPNTISAYTIDGDTGGLTKMATDFATGSSPQSIAVDPFGRFAYVANRSGTVSAYTVSATTGALTRIGTDVAAGSSPQSVTVDPTGRFVYVANSSANTVSAYTIDATTGALTKIGTDVATGTSPQSIAVDPTGRFVYVANGSSHTVSAYTIDATTGSLTKIGPDVSSGSPQSITVEPTGRFAYTVGGTIAAYAVDDATGALSRIGDIASGGSAVSIATTGGR